MLSYVTRQLSKAVDKLREDLVKKIEEQSAATRDAQEAANILWSEIPGIIASSVNPEEEKQATAADREQTHREQANLIASQNRTARWTRNACIAAMAYGLIAAWQGCLIRHTNQLTQKALESERPWVGVKGEVFFDKGETPYVGSAGREAVRRQRAEGRLPKVPIFNLQNSGKRPAFNAYLVVEKFLTFSQKITGDIYPQVDAMIQESCKLAEHAITQQHNGDLLLPGGEHVTPYTISDWSPDEFLFAPGCIAYKDEGGKFHHTGVCFSASMFVSPQPEKMESCGSRMPAD